MAAVGSNVAVALAAATAASAAAANAVINRTLSVEFIVRPKEVLILCIFFLS